MEHLPEYTDENVAKFTKNKPKKVRVKKVYCGCVSIRDYIVKKCAEEGREICVHFRKQKMTLSLDDLKNNFQFHKQMFRSKFGSVPYQLYDFKFIPDTAEVLNAN